MPLQQVVLAESELKGLSFVRHIRTKTEFGTGKKTFEEYEFASPIYGEVICQVPVDTRKKAFKPMTRIKLEGHYLKKRTRVREIRGESSASLEYDLFATDIVVEGGAS